MGETPGSYRCVRRKVASAPPFVTAELGCPAHAVRQPGYLPAKRPLSFAPPPHDRFALLASAHGYACLLAHFQCLLSMHHTLNPRATQYLSEKFGHTEAVLREDVSSNARSQSDYQVDESIRPSGKISSISVTASEVGVSRASSHQRLWFRSRATTRAKLPGGRWSYGLLRCEVLPLPSRPHSTERSSTKRYEAEW
jgi:hypothetical protein